jgi:hypothetical protein
VPCLEQPWVKNQYMDYCGRHEPQSPVLDPI